MENIFSNLFNAIGVGFAGLVGVAFTMLGTKFKSHWDKKQFNKSLERAVDDAIAATEESARTDSSLHGGLKLNKAMEYALADLEANGIINVKPILLEGKIKSALQKSRK